MSSFSSFSKIIFKDSAEILQLKERIYETEQLVSFLKDQLVDDDSPYYEFSLQLYEENSYKLVYLNKMLNREQQFLNKLRIIFNRIIERSPNFVQLEGAVKGHYMLRRRSIYFNSLLVELREALKEKYAQVEHAKYCANLARFNYLSNKFNYNLLEVEDCDESQSLYEDIEEDNSKINFKYFNKRKFNLGNLFYGPQLPFVEENRVRNSYLLSKLHFIINSLRSFRLGFGLKSNYSFKNKLYNSLRSIYNPTNSEDIELAEFAYHEMDKPSAHGDENLAVNESASNVVLTEARRDDEVVASPISRKWSEYVSTDVVGSYDIVTDRWLKIKDFEWSISNAQFSELFRLKLPYDAVLHSPLSISEMPNLMPFRIHRYVRCDMEVKIQLNSNKFQVGQLQCSWFYQPELDGMFYLRENVFSASQTHHVLINASSSNEATLYIPYKNHLPMISTKSRSDILSPLSIGTLYVRVLNPLSVVTNGPVSCNGAIFIRFLNCEFTGMIKASMDPPSVSAQYEMDKVLDIGVNLLKNCLSENEDNPPDRTVPQYLVPTASHSWSLGTDISEPFHLLRLSNRGRTMHPDVVESEQTVQCLSKKFGLVTSVSWSKNHSYGTILWNTSAAPILEMDAYVTVPSKDAHVLTAYYIPPVGVVSSMFNYWRGSIEFRIDVVASQFHTGRLIMGYVPGATSDSTVTINDLFASPHMIFTLQENLSFTYQIPYISNKPFWSRNYVGNHKSSETIAPSRVYLAVINPLIPMDSVVDSIYLNIYMRGGPDFEVSVPVQPCFGLAFNRNVLYSDTERIYAMPGYSPYYAGTWRLVGKGNYLVFRWGTASDEVAEFQQMYVLKMVNDAKKENSDVTKTFTSYWYKFENAVDAPKYQTSTGSVISATQGLVVAGTTTSYSIFVPTTSVETAKKAAIAYYNNYLILGDYDWLLPYAVKVVSTTNNEYIQGNPPIVVQEVSAKPTNLRTDSESSFEEVAVHESERTKAVGLVETVRNLQTTGGGRFLFGENFMDLMDLCRRYQLYGSFRVDISILRQPGQACVNIPVLAQGLNLELGTPQNIVEIANRCRDGHIPLIASGFRYGRGAIRFRFVAPTGTLQAWVQHRPDRKLINPVITIPTVTDRAQSLFNHTYAYYIQDLNVNSIVEFEVPFYQNSAFALLQRPKFCRTDEAFYFGLGDISIGFNYNKADKPDVHGSICAIYYSLGDDYQFSTFQGFPPCILLDDIATPEMGLWDSITNMRSNIKKEVVSDVKDVVDEATQHLSNVAIDKISQLKEVVESKGMGDIINTSGFRCIITNFAHISITSSLKHICVAIVSVFIELGILAQQFMTSALEHIMNILAWIKVDNKSGGELTTPDSATEVAEEAIHNMDDVSQGALAGLIALLWGSICSLLSLRSKPPKNLSQLSNFLTKDLTSCMKSSNIFFVFLRNIFSVMDHMKQYAVGIVSPTYRISQQLEAQYPEVAGWMQEVLTLDDPKYRDMYQYTQLYKQRVDMAFLKGSIIYRSSLRTEFSPMITSISKVYDRIRELRELSIKTGCDSYVRKECFTVWQYGKAGVGKSTVASELIYAMLRSRGITTSVPPIYNHNAASEYWDSCVGNPAMVVDDLFSIQSGPIFEKHLALLFSVHSPVVLCPPKAHLNDKGMTYNPEIFWINSNYDFLRFNGICEDAINRRRHVLFETIPNPTKKPNCMHCIKNIPIADCDKNLLSDYHHVLFVVKSNVLNPDSPTTTYTFSEFKEFLVEEYDRVMTKNEDMYEMRLRQSMELYMDEAILNDPDMHDFTDRIRRQHEILTQRIKEESICSRLISRVVEKQKDFYNYINYIWTGNIRSTINASATPQGDVWKCELDNFNLPDCEEFIVSLGSISMKKLRSVDPFIRQISKSLGRELLATEKRELFKWMQIHESSPISGYSLIQMLEFLLSVCVMEPRKGPNNAISAFSVMKHWYSGYLEYRINCTRDERSIEAYNLYCNQFQRPDNHICSCKHLFISFNPRNAYIKDNVLYSENGENVSILCSGMCDDSNCSVSSPHEKRCMWESNLFKYIWLTEFKNNHLHLFPSRGIFTSYYVRMLSPEFLSRRTVDIPDHSTFKEWCVKIQQCALDIVYKMYSGFKRLFNLIKNIPIELILFVLCGVVAVGQTYALVKCAANGSYPKINGSWESHSYANVQKQNLNAMPRYASPESSPQQVDVAIQRIMSNYFKITCVYNQNQLSCVGLIIDRRRLLLLRHYIEEYEAVREHNPKFYGKYPFRPFVENHGVEFKLFDCKLTYYNVRDETGCSTSNYVLCELPLCFPESKSIIQFIATTKDHQRVFGDCCLVQNNGRVSENIKCVRETNKLLVRGTATTTSTTLYDKYTYRMHARGMCGSILVCNNLERPIIGMHVAGIDIGNERGVAELLCMETFKNVPVTERAYTSFIVPELTDSEFSKITVNSMIYPLGCVDSQYTVFQSGETSYIPSLIQGCFPVKTEPNPLSKKDPRLPVGSSPLALGVENLGKPPIDFSSEEIGEAAWDLEHVLLNTVTPVRNKVGIIDLETAICGNSKIPHFEPLEWSSSPGYPLRFEKKSTNVSGKKYLFDLEQTQDGYKLKGLDPRLQQLLSFDDGCRKRGIKPFTVFIDCLKDTTLPKEKCKIPGKTRIFSISPVQFTIHFKQYFLDFMASYQRARFSAEHAIGIDVNSLEWTELSTLLQSKGPKIICGDYKNFGPGLMKSVASAAFGIILNWYKHHGDETNNAYRSILASEVVDSIHLVSNMIYATPCGIPSGSPITTPLNDMCDSIYLRIGWRRTTNLGYREMHEHCVIVTYGDDVCINITDEIATVFNAKTLQLAFEQNNIIFTDISKEGEIIPYRNLDTCQFLKCSFLPHPFRKGVYTAALDKVSVEGCANWILKRNDPKVATVQNCETVLELAHGWGKEYYNHVRDKMIKACNEVNLTFRAESWEMLDRRRYSLLVH